jgi:YD repeat-containing protein
MSVAQLRDAICAGSFDAQNRLFTATLPEGTATYHYWPDSLLKGIERAERSRRRRRLPLHSRRRPQRRAAGDSCPSRFCEDQC